MKARMLELLTRSLQYSVVYIYNTVHGTIPLSYFMQLYAHAYIGFLSVP